MNYRNINQVIQNLFAKKSLLEVLLRAEKFLDSLNLYVFPNWFKGHVLDGPKMTRYWIDIALCFEHDEMPDPMGAKLLEKSGVKVSYEVDYMVVPVEVDNPEDLDSNNRPKMKKKKVWIVYLSIPRRFIDEADLDDLQIFDQELDIDIEDVSDAEDMGLSENE